MNTLKTVYIATIITGLFTGLFLSSSASAQDISGTWHGKLTVPTGSLTQLVAVCEGEVTADAVNKAMKDAASASFGYTEEELVSSDIVGITYGSLFDATQTKCMPMGDGTTLVKVVSWYDNENSYTSQMVRTIKYFAELK